MSGIYLEMDIDIFVQARMDSTRLPGKVMMEVLRKPLLGFLLERLHRVQQCRDIVVLTSEKPKDQIIVEYCRNQGTVSLTGSEEDVLSRYYQASCKRTPEAIVRITADCPLIDPKIIDQVIGIFKNNYPQYDYVSNTLERTFPRGMDVEVFSSRALEQAFFEATAPEEREHVTLYLYRHPEKFHLKNISSNKPLENLRLTVDTPEDFRLIQLILEELYPEIPKFELKEIVDLLEIHPEWKQINSHISQKKF